MPSQLQSFIEQINDVHGQMLEMKINFKDLTREQKMSLYKMSRELSDTTEDLYNTVENIFDEMVDKFSEE